MKKYLNKLNLNNSDALKLKSKSTYLISIFFLFLILSLSLISATNNINQNNIYTPSLNVSNVSLSGNGNLTFYDGNSYRGVSSGDYDGIICISSNILNDFLPRWLTGCDVVIKSTDSDAGVKLTNAIANGGSFFVKKGSRDYYIATLVVIKSNTKLFSDGAVITTNGTEAVYLPRAMFQLNYGSSIENVTIDGFNFRPLGMAQAISSYGSDNLIIKNNIFSSFNSTINAGGLIFLDQNIGTKNITNTQIINNQFKNINFTNNAVGSIYLYSKNSLVMSDIIIDDNYFYNIITGGNIVILPLSTMRNLDISRNSFINLNCLWAYAGYCSAIFESSSATEHALNGIRINGNYYYTTVSNNNRSAFAMLYASDNAVVSNNVAVVNNLGSLDGMFISVGQTTKPMNNLIISNNYVEGFPAFWDADSMRNVEVSNNIIKNTRDGLGIGYGTQININVHDNQIINSSHYVYNASIYLKCGSPVNSVIRNNIIDYGEINGNKNFIYNSICPANNYSDVVIEGNKYYVNSSLTTLTQVANLSGVALPYISNYQYNSSISLSSKLECGINNAFNERTIHNSTTSCTCTGGAWKCTNFDY